MLTQPVPTVQSTKPRLLNLITIQSKALDENGIPEETETIEHWSDEPLFLQEVRQLFWDRRWTHRVVEHLCFEPTRDEDTEF